MKIKEQIEQVLLVEKAEKHLKALEAAIATMREVPCYGYNYYPVNFRFPTAQDLLQMPKNMAIKVQDLKYKKDTVNNNNYFGGFQLILSNGVSSPLFAG